EAGDTIVVGLDGRTLPSSPAEVITRVAAALGADHLDDAIAALDRRLLVLIDGYEHLIELDDWVRGSLLPRLPDTSLTVVASREGPGPRWRADPAWRDLLRIVALRNLRPEDCARYLHACGIDDADHGRVVELTHGHPLALSLLADVMIRS